MPQTREHLEILRLLGLAGRRRGPDEVRPRRPRLARRWSRRTPGPWSPGRSSKGPRSSGLRRRLGTRDRRASIGPRPRLCESSPDPRRPRAVPDGHRPLVHRRRPRDRRDRHGRLGVGRPSATSFRWLPDGRVGPGPGPPSPRPAGRPGRTRGVRAAINLGGVHHAEVRPRARAGRAGLPRRVPGPVRPGRGLARGSAQAAQAIGPGIGSTWGRPRSPRRSRSWSPAARGRSLAQLLLAEPVAAVHGQPFVIREESPPATVGGGRVLRPSRADESAAGTPRGSPAWPVSARHDPSEPGSTAALAIHGLAMPWTEAALSRDAGLVARPRSGGGWRELIDVGGDRGDAGRPPARRSGSAGRDGRGPGGPGAPGRRPAPRGQPEAREPSPGPGSPRPWPTWPGRRPRRRADRPAQGPGPRWSPTPGPSPSPGMSRG